MYLAGQHRAGAVATKAPPPAHTNEHMQISDCSAALVDPAVSKVEADLACTEDAWDKDSPASKKPFPGRARARTSHAERAPLRRSRPGGSPSVFDCGPHEERLDVLVRMLSAEGKYQPERAPEGRVKCHIVSPFVAERRKWFVAWKNQMANFLGYSRDTVAVALNYFDRYTCARPCSPTLAQAVAATALHVAAKFEESSPASLRQLLKFTPVFTPDQLLVMETSMLKVLNWDLRPVTIYDFVRAFCSLLPAARAAKCSSSSSSRDQDREDMGQLVVGAEEIADLSACDICFVEFMPSTLAISALLLSVSRSHPSAATSHEDMLEVCCGKAGAAAGAAGAGAAAATPDGEEPVSSANFASCALQRVLECVRLLGSSLADRYPAAGAAADLAAEHVTRYAGWEKDGGRSSAAVPESAAAKKLRARTAEEKQPSPPAAAEAAGVAKGRRCSTPTGVEGIMHIEMAAIRNASVAVGGGGGSKASDGGVAVPAKRPAAQQPSSIRAGGVVDGERAKSPKHPRPTPISSTAGRPPRVGTGCASAAAAAAAAAPVARQRSFSFSDGDIAFVAVAAKNKKLASPAAQGARATVAAGGAIMGGATTILEKKDGFSAWNPFSSAALASRGGTLSSAGRKRSAGALGHCESGSGFGAPTLRVAKVARISTKAG